MRVGLHQRPLFVGIVTSAVLHAGGVAVVLSMPPVQARGLAGNLAGRAEAPMMLVAAPVPPPPEQQQPKPVPPPEPKPPPPPPPEPVIRIGVESPTAATNNWLQSLAEGEHAAPLSTVEQPSLRTNVPEPPPAPPPSPGAEAVPATPASPASPAATPLAQPPSEPAPPEARPAATAPAEEPPPPDPAALPSPTRVAPPAPPKATLPPRPPSVQAGVGKPEEKPADRPPLEAPKPEIPPQPAERAPDKPAGPAREGPTESPSVEESPVKPRDEMGPADAIFQQPPPAQQPAERQLADVTQPARPTRPALPAQPPESTPAEARPATPARPASPANPPRPSGRGTDEMDTPAWLSDRESDASSPRRTAVYRNGRVEAGEGLDIKTVRPQFSRFAMTFASPRSAVVEIFFDREGVVKRVKVLRSTGYPLDIDEPIRNAVFNWRAAGKLIRDLPDVPDAGVNVRIEFILG